MKLSCRGKGWLPAVLLCSAGLFQQSVLMGAPALAADEIVQKAVVRAQRPETTCGKPGYTYTKVTLTEELDGDGKVKERKQRVYQVSFQAGSTHVKLLKVNGRPPSPAELKKVADNE